MKTKILSLLAALVALSGRAAAPSGIFPNPQEETVGTTAFDASTASFYIVNGSEADPDAVNALAREVGVADGGNVQIILGEKGDAAVSSVASKIPDYPQGYYLKVEPGKVIIAGNDGMGTYYGVQSFLQLVGKGAVPSIEVKDWPRTEVRGVIEGYYGNPWSHEDCMDMCAFFDRNKMNTFIYGPKNDSYHHGSGVFTEYPAETAANLAALVKEANAHKVDIVWAMHPGNSNDGANLAKAKAKLEAMYQLGFRRFAVFFDDISANSVQKQVDFLNYLNREVVKAKGDVKGLIVCPSEYCISFAGGWNTSSTYLNELGKGLDADIDIMWTGSAVVDMELSGSCQWFTNKTGRKPFIWHNYPCSDYGSRPLLLCPYEPASTDLPSRITGFTANPMEYYEASKVGLYGMADFAWNPEAYDPWEAWEEAVQYIMPGHADAFRTYCYSNFNYPAPKSHGGPIIYDETPDFKALMEAASFDEAAYEAYFTRQVEAATELKGISDNRLVAELAEWIDCYELQGRRGLALIDMRRSLTPEKAADFIAAYSDYAELTKTAEALRSHDYPGSLRVLTPFCGSKYVEPFIGSTVESLIEQFKELGVEYPEGLFPARILQSGDYHIIYKGRYLTNRSGSTYPTFVATPDNVNPNRQVWTIRYVPETGRYSIISAEDRRYVNELGNFGTNEYSDAWNTYTLTSLGGYFAIQNGGSSGTQFWTAKSNRVQKGDYSDWNTDNFMFMIVPAGSEIPDDGDAAGSVWTDDVYVIKNDEGLYMTRSGSELKFAKGGTSSVPVKSTQKWTIAVDPETNRLKISQGSYYVSEHPKIGSNSYIASWNTYKFYELNGKYAIQNGGQAGDNFWYITDSNGLSNESRNLIDAFEFTILPLEVDLENSAITEVVDAPADASGLIFDLQGRRVSKAGRGIYIMNGKKVIF